MTSHSPDTILLPRVLNTPSRLRCRFGWSEEASNALANSNFEKLELSGGDGQDFDLPDLGRSAERVRALGLMASGAVTGIQQLQRVETIDIDMVPKNGVDLNAFPLLKEISFQWDKKNSLQVFECGNIESLGITGFPDKNAERFSSLEKLKVLGLYQSRLENLGGIEACASLVDVSIAYAKLLGSVDGLSSLSGLQRLEIQNAAKAKGQLRLSWFHEMRRLYVANSSLEVDISDVTAASSLELIWLNGVHHGLCWDALFSIKSLRKIGLMVGSKAESERIDFQSFANRHRRVITKLNFAGSTKSRQVQIDLE